LNLWYFLQLLAVDYPPCPESPSGHRAVEVDLDDDPTVDTATSSVEEEEEEEAENVHLDVEDAAAEEVATSRKRSRADERVESSSSEQVAGSSLSPSIDPNTVIGAFPLAFCPPPPVTKKSKHVGRWNLLGLSSKNPVPVQSGE